MTGPTSTEEEDFGYAFTKITSLTVGTGCLARASVCPAHRHVDEPTALTAVSADYIRRRLGIVSPRM